MFVDFKIHLVIFILIITSILWGCVSYSKLKQKEILRLQRVYQEINFEKGIKEKLKYVKIETSRTESKIQEKLVKIKIDIFNLNFTLNEIFHS